MLTVTPILAVRIEYPLEKVLEEEIKPVLYKICLDSQPLEKTFKMYLSELFSLRMKMTYQLLQEGVDLKKAFESIEEILPQLKEKIEGLECLIRKLNLNYKRKNWRKKKN